MRVNLSQWRQGTNTLLVAEVATLSTGATKESEQSLRARYFCLSTRHNRHFAKLVDVTFPESH